MKKMLIIAILLAIFGNSCKTVKVTVKGYASVQELEASIHRQFYQALQEIHLDKGIVIIPLNVTVKFDHAVTSTAGGGFTILSIVQSANSYQNLRDLSVTDILAPTKLPSAGASSKGERDILEVFQPNCPFYDSVKNVTGSDSISLANLKRIIIDAVNSFANTPNLGPLNDHQISVNIKFSISADHKVIVNPGFSIGSYATSFNFNVERNNSYSNEMTFNFDIVQNEVNGLMGHDEYYKRRKDKLMNLQGIYN